MKRDVKNSWFLIPILATSKMDGNKKIVLNCTTRTFDFRSLVNFQCEHEIFSQLGWQQLPEITTIKDRDLQWKPNNHHQKSQKDYHDFCIKDRDLQWKPNTPKFGSQKHYWLEKGCVFSSEKLLSITSNVGRR